MSRQRQRPAAHLVGNAARLLVAPVVDAVALHAAEPGQARVERFAAVEHTPPASRRSACRGRRAPDRAASPPAAPATRPRGPSSSGNDARSRMFAPRIALGERLPGTATRVSRSRQRSEMALARGVRRRTAPHRTCRMTSHAQSDDRASAELEVNARRGSPTRSGPRCGGAARPHVRAIVQLRVLVRESDAAVRDLSSHVSGCSRLPSCASWMSAKSASSSQARSMSTRPCRVIADRSRDRQSVDAQLVKDAQREGPMRNAVAIDRRLVARLAAAAAPELRKLRVDVGKGERVRSNERRVARPRAPAVDGQAERAEKTRFAEVVAGQGFVSAALALRVDDEERRALPRIQLRRTDQCHSHGSASTVEVGREQLSAIPTRQRAWIARDAPRHSMRMRYREGLAIFHRLPRGDACEID